MARKLQMMGIPSHPTGIAMIQQLQPNPVVEVSSITQRHIELVHDDAPTSELRGRLIKSSVELEAIIDSWDRLVETSVRKNPFLDPDFLIPAFKHLNEGDVKILVVDAPQHSHPDGPRVLCALLPIVTKRVCGLRCCEVWQHNQSFDATPLIRQEVAGETINFIFQFIADELKSVLFSLKNVTEEGDFAKVLSRELVQGTRKVFNQSKFSREELAAEKHTEGQDKHDCRSDLSGLGELKAEVLTPDDDVDKWASDLLKIESSNWTGEQASMASCSARRLFFRELLTRSLSKRKLSMLKVDFIGQPIGILCDLYQGNVAVQFKACFDNSYSRYTPALIAELKSIHRRFDEYDQSANQVAVQREWSGRTRYQTLVVVLTSNKSKWAAVKNPLLKLASNRLQSKS